MAPSPCATTAYTVVGNGNMYGYPQNYDYPTNTSTYCLGGYIAFNDDAVRVAIAGYVIALAWLFIAFLLATIDHAEGQTIRTDAVCTNSTWTWSFNSKGQSPCLVAAYLLAPCGELVIPPIGPYIWYAPSSQVDNCQCSTVSYSVMSACGLCQSGIAISWSSWRANCTDSITSISKYPNQISPSTAVPAWAYLDVVTADSFSPTLAMEFANVPDSTVGNLVPTSSTNPTPAPNNGSKSTPAIIGGLIGGMVGLGLIVLLTLYLRKRSSNKRIRGQHAPYMLYPSTALGSTRPTMDVPGPAVKSPDPPPKRHSIPDTSGPK